MNRFKKIIKDAELKEIAKKTKLAAAGLKPIDNLTRTIVKQTIARLSNIHMENVIADDGIDKYGFVMATVLYKRSDKITRSRYKIRVTHTGRVGKRYGKLDVKLID